MTLDEFVVECKKPGCPRTTPRAWLKDGFVTFYVRKTEHFLDGKKIQTFDLANGGVEESEQGKGHFRAFLERVEVAADALGCKVYVENVLNPKLAGFLQRRGYYESQQHEHGPPCFWRLNEV